MKYKVSVIKKIAFLVMTMALAGAMVACKGAVGPAGPPGPAGDTPTTTPPTTDAADDTPPTTTPPTTATSDGDDANRDSDAAALGRPRRLICRRISRDCNQRPCGDTLTCR